MKILKLIAIGAVILAIGGAPSPKQVSRILRELTMGDSTKNRQWARRRMYEMRRKAYIRPKSNRFVLTKRGARFLKEAEMYDMKIKVPALWDKKWHLVVFDIPKERGHVRIYFTRRLMELGLAYYQRSIWVHPFQFEKEVIAIARHYDIGRYVSFITASHIDGDSALRKHFKLSV